MTLTFEPVTLKSNHFVAQLYRKYLYEFWFEFLYWFRSY